MRTRRKVGRACIEKDSPAGRLLRGFAGMRHMRVERSSRKFFSTVY